MSEKAISVKRNRFSKGKGLENIKTGDKLSVGKILFEQKWNKTSDFKKEAIKNGGLTKEDVKQDWLASKFFKGFVEEEKNSIILRTILRGTKNDTGYKEVKIRTALGAIKTIIDKFANKKSPGETKAQIGNNKNTIGKISLFKKKTGKEIASVSLTKKEKE
jgi:hypothetical protein